LDLGNPEFFTPTTKHGSCVVVVVCKTSKANLQEVVGHVSSLDPNNLLPPNLLGAQQQHSQHHARR
jgi:hypothetical protein